MAKSTFIGNVHVVDHGGSGPPAVLVHGLGGSHVNWSRVADRLGARAFALDLPGFGLSPPARRCDIDAHAAAVRLVIESLREPAFVIGNSMGGLVSMLVAADSPELVSGLVMVDPAVPIARGTRPPSPVITTRLLLQSLPGLGAVMTNAYRVRHTPEEQVRLTLDAITAGRERVPPEAVDEAIDMARIRAGLPWVGKAFQESAASTRSILMSPNRYRSLLERVSAPALLIWGTHDPVASPASIEAVARLRPDWNTVAFEGIGHVPQLEAPERFVEVVSRWIAQVYSTSPG